jgi:hypothetical protein
MTKRIRELEQRYNALLDEIRQMDEAMLAGRIRTDNCCFILFYRQACKARDRLLDQIKVEKINVTMHEQQHGFALVDGKQLKLNLICESR